LHVVPQRQDALLRVVPLLLVQNDVQLNRGGFVSAQDLLAIDDVDRLAIVIDRRICERRAMLWTERQPVQHESRRWPLGHLGRSRIRRWTVRGGAVWMETVAAAYAEELHRDLFDWRSLLG